MFSQSLKIISFLFSIVSVAACVGEIGGPELTCAPSIFQGKSNTDLQEEDDTLRMCLSVAAGKFLSKCSECNDSVLMRESKPISFQCLICLQNECLPELQDCGLEIIPSPISLIDLCPNSSTRQKLRQCTGVVSSVDGEFVDEWRKNPFECGYLVEQCLNDWP